MIYVDKNHPAGIPHDFGNTQITSGQGTMLGWHTEAGEKLLGQGPRDNWINKLMVHF